jgi:hypothetical protein
MTTLLDDYLLPAQLASELKITTKTLERWRVIGAAPPVTKIGRRIYYARESVRAAIVAAPRPHPPQNMQQS